MAMNKNDVEIYLEDNEAEILEKVSKILNKDTSLSSFNGIIGGKNATYEVDALDYDSAEDYIEAWMNSHDEKYNDEKNYLPHGSKSSHRVHDILMDNSIKTFAENYLARTYFRKHK